MNERWKEDILQEARTGKNTEMFPEVRQGWVELEEKVSTLQNPLSKDIVKLQKCSNILKHANSGVPWVLIVFIKRILKEYLDRNEEIVASTTIEPAKIESIKIKNTLCVSIPINQIEDPFNYPIVMKEVTSSIYEDKKLAEEVCFLIFKDAYSMSAKEHNLLYNARFNTTPPISPNTFKMVRLKPIERKDVIRATELFVSAIPPVEFESLPLLMNALWMAFTSKGNRKGLSELFLTTIKLIEVKRLWEDKR